MDLVVCRDNGDRHPELTQLSLGHLSLLLSEQQHAYKSQQRMEKMEPFVLASDSGYKTH